jgi:hypothetical protein
MWKLNCRLKKNIIYFQNVIGKEAIVGTIKKTQSDPVHNVNILHCNCFRSENRKNHFCSLEFSKLIVHIFD